MIVIVTGSPGTGKTKLSLVLSKKLGYSYVDVNDFLDVVSDGYDPKDRSHIVDTKKLNSYLKKKYTSDVVIDSHLSHYLPKSYVDLCIVTKCELGVLKKRLEKRKYSAAKVRENLDAEIFDVCLTEAKEKGHHVLIVDTTKGLKNTEILRIVGEIHGKSASTRTE